MAKTPVCVIGLGLIGGSLMRAAKAAGREVFGYNRSVDGVDAARRDGFDATSDLGEALSRAAAVDALIVLAVPMPALPLMLRHVRDTAPNCALTDVTSVKGAVLREVDEAGLLDRFVGGHPMTGTAYSGWAAGDTDLFDDTPWVLSVDDHVDPGIWATVMHLAATLPLALPIRNLVNTWRKTRTVSGLSSAIRMAKPVLPATPMSHGIFATSVYQPQPISIIPVRLWKNTLMFLAAGIN